MNSFLSWLINSVLHISGNGSSEAPVPAQSQAAEHSAANEMQPQQSSDYSSILEGYDSGNYIWQLIKESYDRIVNGTASNKTEMLDRLSSMADMLRAGDYRGVQGMLGNLAGSHRIPEEWLNNMIANQSTLEAQERANDVAKNSTLWLGDQLSQLGLSPSGVLSMGSNNIQSPGAANVQMTNNRARMREIQYQQRMAMARQLLGMTSSMASAGIYGSALGKAKQAASIVGSAAAHSGLANLRAKPGKKEKLPSWQSMISGIEAANPSSTNWTDDL